MSSYPIIKIAVFFSGGILFSRIADINLNLTFILSISILLLSLSSLKFFKDISSSLLLISIFFAGYLWTNISKSDIYIFPQDIYRIKELKVYGEITEIQLIKKKELSFFLISDSLKLKDKTLIRNVKFLCKVRDINNEKIDSLYNIVQPGNYIELKGIYFKGREMRNPGEFDYNNYLNSAGITGIVLTSGTGDVAVLNNSDHFFKSLIFSVRKYLDKEIKSIHNKETASLLKGLLLADRSEIDYVTKTQFINAGIVHILAVSGLHVGFIAVVFLFLFGRLNIYLRSVFTITGLIVFMFITGIQPSVFRATLMAVIIITAFILNRSTNLFNSLALAALIILLFQPAELFNPGFQLSFSAVLGIGIIFPQLEKFINSFSINSNSIRHLLLFMGVSLSAQVGTLPFTLIYFGKLSIISLLANLFIIPLTAIIVGLGILTLFINSILPFIGAFYASANELVTKLLFIIAEYSGSLSFSYIPIKNFSVPDAVFLYLFLFLLFYSVKKIERGFLKLAVIILIIINFLLFSSLDDEELISKGKLTIMAIDVGQGDALLVKFPNGTTALIDAGNVTPFFDNGDKVILPLLDYLGIEKIDYGFVTHIDSDHYAGFVSLVNAGVIKKMIKPELDTSLVKDIKFEKYLADNKVDVRYYQRGKIILDDVPVYILSDEKLFGNEDLSSNDKSGVLKIVYGKTSFLFAGDIEKAAENIYSKEYKSFLDSDLLKVAHHGSKTSSIPEFINYVTPEYSVISAGILNKFNHPSAEVVERLENIGSKIYRTDKYGALIFESNGDSISFIDWKKLF